MTVYMVVDLEVKDEEAYEEYRKLVPPFIEKHGGRYLVRGGEVHAAEGGWDVHRIVILEFPSVEAAQGLLADPEYAPVAALRYAAAETKMFVVEGV